MELQRFARRKKVVNFDVFRLKEVMEYSTSPVLEASGEYVSLIERDIRCASSEEDDDHSFASREI